MGFTDKIMAGISSLLRPPLLGMDISDLSMKYVQFSRRGNTFSFTRHGEIEIPEGIIAGGEIKKEEELARLLLSWRKKEMGSKSAAVAASLPEEKSFMRLIQIPKIKREEVANAVKWEIEANVPLPLGQLRYDFEIIEPLSDSLAHLDVLISAFPKTIVDSYVRALEQAGFMPYALEVESQSIARSVLPDLRTRTTYLLTDIGKTRTGLTIFSGGAIVFTTTLPLGGATFEENIAKTLGVTPGEARALKKEYGLDKKARGGEIFSALLPSLSALADESRRAMEYYKNHAGHRHGASESVNKLLLLGGDANLAGLDTFLASALKIPAERADTFAAIKNYLPGSVPPLARNESLAYGAAIGLALRGFYTQPYALH